MTNHRLLPLLLALSTAPLAAQGEAPLRVSHVPAVVKYGKWVLIGAAVGFGLKAEDAHRDADRAFNRLERYCLQDEARCDQSPDGRYLDSHSESLYQTSLRRDRQARGWLVGGEGALVGAVGLFIWELTRPKRPPENIPFHPEIQVTPGVSRLKLQVRF